MQLYRISLRSWLVLVWWLCSVGTAGAQTATLRGFVTNQADGQPMPGVNVILTTEEGGLYGAATDSDGFYAVSRLAPGTYVLQATFIGFETHIDTLRLEAGIRTLNIALAESATELEEVVVETERTAAGAANVSAGLQTIRPGDIELVPMPDISADLVNYLTSMPGVISQGDRGGQLFIRGGEPSQNMILLDGMLIFQPFHVIGFFSAFPSEIINTADVYAGGFGSRYGGRLSSVIDIAARTGNKEAFAGAVSVAPFVSTARLEGPIIPGRLSMLVSARESVIEQGAARLIDEPLPFRFGDRFGKLHANVTPSLQFSLTALHTNDRGRLGLDPLKLNPEIPGEDEVTWENFAIGARSIFLPAHFPIFAEILLSTSRVESAIGPAQRPTRTSETERTGVSVNVTQYLGNLDLNWGLSLHTIRLQSDLGGLFQNLVTQEEYVTEASLYFEPSYLMAGSLRIQPGLRLQTFPSKNRSFLEPRLRVVWNTGIHRFSAAAGIYHQEVVGLNDRRDAGDIFTAWTASPLAVVPEAQHAILGWRVSPLSWLDVSIEGFYKRLEDLVVPEWTAFPRFTTRLHPARGEVSGVDLRLETSAGPFYSAVNYGYAEVNYYAQVPALQLRFGEDETAYRPPHDRTHQVSLLGSLSQWGFDLNVRWQFGSGLPFNEAMGFDRFVLLDSLVNVLEEPGRERVLYERPYTGRLPTYHRLDISLERDFTLPGRTTLGAQVGLINIYDRRNLFYLDLFTLRRVDQLPLIPSFGLKLEYN